MTRSCKFCHLHWQQGLIVVFVSVAIRLSEGSQNCSGEPCMYGICMNGANGSYSCYCIDGYTGINCEINWDDCWSNPCLNGGTCNDAVASYNCTCPDGFVGLNCEEKYSECMNQPCLNNGTCIDYNGFMCQCPEGYSGDYCEIDASVCNNTICKNGGECMEGPGYSFYCRCTEGWTGVFCEEDVDECVASPCQNGGLCLNIPSTYTCACLFGFTGKDCDKTIVPCDSNICKNDAMCLLEDSQPVCYCVPDYHGQLCELRYNDCESKFARCENGGTCIDGINAFTCACPPEYAGEMCLDYNPTSTTSEHSYATGRTVPLPTMIYFTSQETESSSSSITSVHQEVSTSPTLPLDGYDVNSTVSTESTSYPSVKNISVLDGRPTETDVPPFSVTTPTIEDDLGASPTGVYLTAFTAAISAQSGIVTETPLESTTIPYTAGIDGSDEATTLEPTEIESSTREDSTSGETLSPVEVSTVFQMHEITTAGVSEPLLFSSTTVDTKTGPTVEEENAQGTSQRAESEDGWSTLESDVVTDVGTAVPETIATSPTTTTLEDFDGQSRGLTDSKTDVTPIERSTDLWSSRRDDASTAKMPIVTVTTTSTTGQTERVDLISTTSSQDNESPRYNCSEECSKACAKNATRCECDSGHVCKNGPRIENAAFNGKSYVRQQVSIDGDGSLRIYLRLKTKSKSGVLVHAFFDDERYVLLYMEGGQLKFQFSCGLQTMLLGEIDSPINNGYDVDVEMRLQYVSGTKNVGKYSAKLLVNDTRNLAVFCITQTAPKELHLADKILEANNFFTQSTVLIETKLEMKFDVVQISSGFQYVIGTDDIGKCSARLLVNDTMAMSGEQILSSHENIPRQVRMHLGGIPQAFSHYFPRIAMGFVGCMSRLKVNNVPRHFIQDSLETFQIEECTSFLCLLNPCRNFGSCHDIDGQLYCKCIAGYSGAFCERSACDDNPCYLGATCISSPGTGFICVCPLGMHGLLCEEETAIVQPSFSVFIPGFSSYAAYGLTNAVKDGMELRMRLLPHSVDQISLIAFMGQSGASRDVPDHFSLTYVRGYIMLTWDLGSGVRRIFTKSPLTTPTHKPHTLRVGRRGRDAWLSVDGLGNVTGKAAGSMTQLDVSPILYIGGHKARNFDTLPHDLPLHTGFSGCIFDIELRTGETVLPITKSSPATGRGVAECHRNECSHNVCKNGALCLNHGPTYSCVCMKEWEGADCSVPAVTCSSSSSYKCQKANVIL